MQRLRERAKKEKHGQFDWSDGRPIAMRAALSLVLDCSATLAWIYPDETTAAIRQVFDVIAADGCFVRRSGDLRSPTV